MGYTVKNDSKTIIEISEIIFVDMSTNEFIHNFDSLSSYLRGFAMKLTSDKSLAEDLFQETALSAFRHRDKFRAGTNMKAWLSTIMKNSFINQFRKKQRRIQIQDNAEENRIVNARNNAVYNDGEMKIKVEEITNLIDELDDVYRTPFMMVYQGYKYDEISKALNNTPMGTIKSRVHYARKMLKNRLQEVNTEALAN